MQQTCSDLHGIRDTVLCRRLSRMHGGQLPPLTRDPSERKGFIRGFSFSHPQDIKNEVTFFDIVSL